MQVIRWMLVFCLLVPSLSFAQQPAPDRREEVRGLVQKYRPMLTGDDDKGRIVTGLMCNDLNVFDGGLWGMLIKNDRNPPFVPYDVLVWKPTLEHFDVLSGVNPEWINDGPIREGWAWLVCPLAEAPPPPVVVVPPPVTQPPLDLATIYAKLESLSVQLKEHDENPSFIKKLVTNPYFQVLATALTTWLTTQQVMK